MRAVSLVPGPFSFWGTVFSGMLLGALLGVFSASGAFSLSGVLGPMLAAGLFSAVGVLLLGMLMRDRVEVDAPVSRLPVSELSPEAFARRFPLDRQLSVVLEDVHLLSVSEDAGFSSLRLSAGSGSVEFIDEDGVASPAPGVSPGRLLVLEVPSSLPAAAREAAASGLPGRVRVLGSIRQGDPPSFVSAQLVVDFPLWSEAYL